MKIICSGITHKIKHAVKALKRPLCDSTISSDIIQFSTSVKPLKYTKKTSEVKKLVRLFFESSDYCLNGKRVSKGKIKDFFYRMRNRFDSIPCEFFAKEDNAVTAVIKNKNNKIVGGYSMYKEPRTCTADLGIFTISPELRNTRTSKQMLMSMMKSMYEKAYANNVVFINCGVPECDKSLNKLLGKLKPMILSEGPNIEYSIPVQNLKSFFEKYINLSSMG